VSIQGVKAAYGRIEVIHGVDLEIPAGSVFALLGPNGAGKSTLLATISGRMHPTHGQVVIGDRPNGRTSPEALARRGICSIPEGRGVFPNLTVRENLRIWTYSGGASLADVEEKAYATFPRLSERRKQLAGSMSGGEQQMLAISRALVIVSELYQLVGRLAAGGMTILLVEQFVTTAADVATDAAIMVQGRIQQVGTPEEMAHAALGIYLSSKDVNNF
jgi:branched-chain amino acid transport system ATP-binding protein